MFVFTIGRVSPRKPVENVIMDVFWTVASKEVKSFTSSISISLSVTSIAISRTPFLEFEQFAYGSSPSRQNNLLLAKKMLPRKGSLVSKVTKN